MLAVYSGPFATTVALTTQPGPGQPGVALTVQPAGQLRAADGSVAVGCAGVVVTCSVLTGPGTVTAGATATVLANGTFTFAGLALSTVGSYTLRFAVTTPASHGVTPVTSSPVAVAPVATQLAILSGPTASTDNQTFPTPFVVELRDAANQPVAQAGVTVTASIASTTTAGVLIGTGTAVTDANGRATFAALGIDDTTL